MLKIQLFCKGEKDALPPALTLGAVSFISYFLFYFGGSSFYRHFSLFGIDDAKKLSWGFVEPGPLMMS